MSVAPLWFLSPPRSLRVPITVGFLAVLSAAPLWSQAVPPSPAGTAVAAKADDDIVRLDAVISTGSRFNDRTVVDSPVPIDVVTRQELNRTGSPELSQMLQAQIPSFNFPRPAVTDGTDHIRPATLRGLAPDQVLVLVNGKRQHTSALVNLNGSIGRGSVSTDFNAIPSMAIAQVEVLRDGDSAQYGSDAIAGVINVILRKDLGWGLDLSYGETKAGDGQDYKADAFAGVTLGGKGSLFINTWVRDHSPTNRSEPDTRQQYFGLDPSGTPVAGSGNYGSGTGLSAPAGTLDPRETTVNRLNHRFGDPLTKDKGLWLNGDYPLTADLDLYFFGGASDRHADSVGYFRRANDDRTLRALYPDGFLPFIQTDVQDYSGAVGLKGHVASWAWDASTVYGVNTLDYRTANSENVTLGAASPTSFYDGQLKFAQWTTNLDLTNEFYLGLPSPLKVGVGGEHRWEQYGIAAGEPDSYRNGGVAILDGPAAGSAGVVGAQVLPGFTPAQAGVHQREAEAVYLDFEQQVHERLLLSLTGRLEDYSDFGSNATAKLAARVKLSDAWAIRGSASTGFHAPHLAQSWFSSTATNTIGGVPYDIITFPVSSPAAIALGSTPLKPEKSVNTGTGLTWNPTPAFSASVDYYHIDIKDRIVLSSNFLGAPVIALLATQGITGVGGGRYFTNAIDTTTQGVDFSARYTIKTDQAGRFIFTAGYNHNQTRATRIKQAPANLAAITTTPLFDLTETVRMEKGQPKDNLNLSAHWDFKRWSLLVREVRYGEVSAVAFASATPQQVAVLTPGYDVALAPAVPATVGGTTTNQQIIQTFGAKWLTDLDIGYKLTKNLTLSVGASNLFDVYPDKNIGSTLAGGVAYNGSDNVGIFPYNGISPFGFNGALYYTKASYRF